MSLITEFQEALFEALENYKLFYSKKNIPIPPDREKELFTLNNLLKAENNVLTLRQKFIERYNALLVPGIVKLFPFLDKSLLRRNLKEVLFNKKYSEKALRRTYLNELIDERSVHSKEKQLLLIKIAKLENDLLEMRKQNHKLYLQRSYLLNINRKLKDQNLKLKELLKNNNISLEEYNLEEFSDNDVSFSLEGSSKTSTLTEQTSNQVDEANSATNVISAPMPKTDIEALRRELFEAQKQINALRKQITLLTESKEKMLNSNLKVLQKEIKELDESENEIQKIETMCSINNNTNVTQINNNEPQKQEFQNSSSPPYFYRTFTH